LTNSSVHDSDASPTNVAFVVSGRPPTFWLRGLDGADISFTPVELIDTASASVDRMTPRVAWTGSEYGVAWSTSDRAGDLTRGGGVWFQRFDAAGTPLSTPVEIFFAMPGRDHPLFDLEYSAATGYGLLYDNPGGPIAFRHLGPTGTTPGPEVLFERADRGALDISPSGEAGILFWRLESIGPFERRHYFYFARVSATSVNLGRTLIEPFTATTGTGDILWDGAGWTAAAQRTSGLVLMRGTTALANVLTLRPSTEPGSATVPTVALLGEDVEIAVGHDLWRVRLIAPSSAEIVDPMYRVPAVMHSSGGVQVLGTSRRSVLLTWVTEVDRDVLALPVTLSTCP
jgi:hypothetical protein